MATEIGLLLSMHVDKNNFYQTNKVGHTRAPMWQRIVTPPLFDGKVKRDKNYILVNDHTGAGGTLTNLRGYIEKRGGRVIAMTTLTASQNATQLPPTQDILNVLSSNYGEELQQFWQKYFGYKLDCVTAIEARTISRQPSFEQVRDFIFKATNEANRAGAQTASTLA